MRFEVVCRHWSLRKAAAPKEKAKSREVTFTECGFLASVGAGGEESSTPQEQRLGAVGLRSFT
jgi:hypothetical protein